MFRPFIVTNTGWRRQACKEQHNHTKEFVEFFNHRCLLVIVLFTVDQLRLGHRDNQSPGGAEPLGPPHLDDL